ncbi:hypothetical protein ADIS_0304 [Lunatimonas lonarensis]|uniref:Uncharacterized protein n=1 Tax=Lunatimonas lonarensis TaxID=1232681 RepID=R7ZYN1_9BACT|nr:hypothetical protein [Lunatimonas lonarensis]EON79195.1 hypothetical protein ADIS_0304 [Lunatimonas lonarensis]
MKWIREHFIKKALAKPTKTPVKKNIPNYQEIRSVCLIGQSREELDRMTSQLLDLLGDHLAIKGFFYEEKSDDPGSFSYKDFSLFAKPEQKLAEFLTLRPDLIIFTPEKENFFSTYLLHLKPSPYAIGFYSEPLKPYLDLMLDKEGKDIQSATEQLIKYLKQIN